MESESRTDRDQIGVLRVNGAREDSPSLRYALSGLLDQADLRPAGISPSAILVVRRLQDPLPGHLSARNGLVRLDSAWERAIRSALADRLDRAARPMRGRIAADAEAVLFADEAEMLACLALDVLHREARSRWWWKIPLRLFPSSTSNLILSLFLDRVNALPAIVFHLTAWDRSAAVVGALSPPEARTLVAALSRVYGLVEPSPEPAGQKGKGEAAGPTGSPQAVARDAAVDGGSEDAGGQAVTASPASETGRAAPTSFRSGEAGGAGVRQPPWERWIRPAAVPPHLGWERRHLLGLALALYHQPAAVRTPQFARELYAWRRLQDIVPTEGRTTPLRTPRQGNPKTKRASSSPGRADSYFRPASDTESEAADRADPGSSSEATGADAFLEEKVAEEHRGLREVSVEEAVGSQAAQRGSRTDRPAPEEAARTTDAEPQHAPICTEARPHETERPETLPQAIYPPGEQVIPDPIAWSEEGGAAAGAASDDFLHLPEGHRTELAGVFYLVNLMAYLDLPHGFEEEWSLASQVGAWGVLDALARALLAPTGAAYADDPVWQVLSALEGRRAGDKPGAALPIAPSFHLPAAWHRPFAAESRRYFWSADGTRLHLWTDTGYLLVESPLDTARPAKQAQQALEVLIGEHPYTMVERPREESPVWRQRRSGRLLKGMPPGLLAWLARVLPYLCFRLRQTPALEPQEEARIADALLLCRGRLYVSSSHVDVVIRLENVSLPARIAGLDRDPGWLADFGRVILFHFE